MSNQELTGHESPARPEEQLRHTQVTATSTLGADGTARTTYRVNGRSYSSVELLEAELGVTS
jgi:hypothetical protein